MSRWLLLCLLLGCRGTITDVESDAAASDDATDDAAPDSATDTAPDAVIEDPKTPGRDMFFDTVQGALLDKCGSCHSGERFGISTIVRAGAAFTEEESKRNYAQWKTMISIDAPSHSRALEKINGAMDHAGGKIEDAALQKTLTDWIALEKKDRCADCGLAAPTQYLAFVKQPSTHWALPRFPVRGDWGLRTGAKIMMQPIDPATFKPKGPAFEFLGSQYSDYGHIAISHDGKRMAFECKTAINGEPLFEQNWNICLADIGPDGKAVSPRHLMPKEKLHYGFTFARATPFGLYDEKGHPLRLAYDGHFQVRRRHDKHPTWGPDDSRIYFSSMGPDPRTGDDAMQTYHGFEHLDHIIAVKPDGTDPRSIYLNEGGSADYPFFLKNGNVAFHTWNLERIDRHMYQQARADGMGEIPVLFGRNQGPSMWGKAAEIANGTVIGMTGIRRGALDNFVPFAADHTLGSGTQLNPGLASYVLLDPELKATIPEFGYCEPKEGANCKIPRFFEDANYSPDGRAFVAHDPNTVYTKQGEEMYRDYGVGTTVEERLASLAPYLPKSLGISLIDHRGKVERFLDPEAGTSYRYPAWVGPRQKPAPQAWITDEAQKSSELHIPDFPVWLTFRDADTSPNKTVKAKPLESIVAVRVLNKSHAGNDCLNDGHGYRQIVNDDAHDHPTHLGIINSTGYVQLGDDIPLAADKSIRLRVPAGKLLLLQGVDAKGFVVRQRSTVFALPPGHKVDSGVKRAQYQAQCGSCHGQIDDKPFVPLKEINKLTPGALDYATEAKLVDLTSAPTRPLTFLASLRKTFDDKCVSCHSGSSPGGQLSLEAKYSATANYPAGKWATTPGLANGAYLSFVPADKRVPGYNYSVAYKWALAKSDGEYQNAPQYKPLIDSWAPVGPLGSWDPAYQNLHAKNSDGSLYYLGSVEMTAFGRSDTLMGNARTSFLLEVLTGDDLDPKRSFTGMSHKGMLSAAELKTLTAVIDIGFPFMTRCDERTADTGPNAGKPWGDPKLSVWK
jgi:hypothetical protein